MPYSNYTEPLIYAPDNHPKLVWRITWKEQLANGEWKRARPTGNFYRIHNLKERLRAAGILQQMISNALSRGRRYYAGMEESGYTNTKLIDALQFHVENKQADRQC